MFKCLNCKSEFLEPRKQRVLYDDPPFTDTEVGCPSCGYDYKLLLTCTYCGKEIEDTYTELPDENIGCPECVKLKSVYEFD